MRKSIIIILFLILTNGYIFPDVPVCIFMQSEEQTKRSNSEKFTLEFVQDTLPFGITYARVKYEPDVTLAMSGGGARGLAQIGLFKALVENGIHVNNIVGTSMGSIVGGLLALGYTIQELDSIAASTDWNELILGGEVERTELFFDQKTTLDKAFITLRLDGLNLVLPTSLNSGLRVSNFLTMLTLKAPVKVTKSFDDLRYNFRAVCTDLVSGNEVVLEKGSLGHALRASSSVSFLLAPVKYDTTMLVDGGLVANLPISAAKKMKSDLLLVFDTTSPLHDKNALKMPWNVADQMVSIPMIKLSNQELTNADVVLKPDLSNITNTDFDKIDDIIATGVNFGKNSSQILNEKFREAFVKKLAKPDEEYFNVDFICADKDVPGIIDLQIWDKERITTSQIYFLLYKIYSTGKYSDVSAEIKSHGMKSSLTIQTTKNFTVSKILVNGATLVNGEDIENRLKPLVNKPYNPEKLYKSLLEVLKLYRNKGYACVQPNIMSIDTKSGVIELEIVESKLDGISIMGNEKTDTGVILRDIPIRRHDFVSHDKIGTGLSNLRSSDLFSNIELNIEEIDNRKILDIDVDEKVSSLIRLGLRVDNENFTQLWLDAREENFLGSATELGAAFTLGSRNRQYMVEHKANRIFNTYFTYRVQLFYKRNEISTYKDVELDTDSRFQRDKSGEYWQMHYGGAMSLGTQVGKFGKIFAEGKYQVDQIKNNFNYSGDIYRKNLVAGRVTLAIDSRDDYPFPNSGFWVNTYYETAQELLGGEFAYAKFYFDYVNYFQMNGSHNFRPRLIFGFADATLPFSQQFSLGGQNMFYGLRSNEFRGRQIMVASMEYRYFINLKFLFDAYFKFRYDVGSVWSNREAIRWKDLRHGLGGAFAFNTPIGPAEFSFGRSFLIKRNLPESTFSWGPLFFYFTIGYEY